ncbi:helix-turn-helix transcriptional regulator, partial [Spelaeicoccus albus]
RSNTTIELTDIEASVKPSGWCATPLMFSTLRLRWQTIWRASARVGQRNWASTFRKVDMRHPKIRERVAANIRARRIEAGLSQEQLAKLAGVERKTINRTEAIRTSPRIDVLGAIAEALNSSVEDLIRAD